MMLLKFVTFIIISTIYIFEHHTAYGKCPGNFRGDGSITFYWKEKRTDRAERMRNWGVLEETLEEEEYKRLIKYFDPMYVYAYTVSGDCCWEIYNERNFKGTPEKLSPGFRGIPNYPKYIVQSVKKVRC